MNTTELKNIFTHQQLGVLRRRGITHLNSLLSYFPRKHIDRSAKLDLSKSQIGNEVTFIAIVKKTSIHYGRKRRFLVEVNIEGNSLLLSFFQGVGYYSKVLKLGTKLAFSGKIELFQGRLQIIHPEIEMLDSEELKHMNRIVPIYHITEAMRKSFLTARVLRTKISEILKKAKIEDFLTEKERKQFKLEELQESISEIHFPQSFEKLRQARKRMVFQEFLNLAIQLRKKKEALNKIKKNRPHPKNNWLQIASETLPFQLTKDQKEAIHKLLELGSKPQPFFVLLQGDVGSGKTLVALLYALSVMDRDQQVAFLVPTEVLARQHYKNFINLLAAIPMIPIELIIGAEKSKDRQEKLDRLVRGEIRLLIGTHAIIQDDIQFYNLSLAIIDEQHRFGVKQRKSLLLKGEGVDLLSMSATPIPRTLTLSVYGNMESIIIKEKPLGRLPIETKLFTEKDLQLLYAGIKKYVDQGRQAYIIYPLIEKNESSQFSALMADFDHLEKNIFYNYRVGLLHGKLTSEEKERAMRKFQEGLIQILVTTTVVEVGVDVPNANVILIRDAQKFGLSQLHQLRGRIGRGKYKSFCILVAHSGITLDGKKRLNAMIESNDGFFLAQKDFEIRGAGELTGLQQSGAGNLLLANLYHDNELAELAFRWLEENPELTQKFNSRKKDPFLLGEVIF